MAFILLPDDRTVPPPGPGYVQFFRDTSSEKVRARDPDGTVRDPTEIELAQLRSLGKF